MANGSKSSDPGPYISYLEKEMTIMGVLSAFCMGSIALLVDKVIFASDGQHFLHWEDSKCYIWAGCALIFVSSFLFYIQRSGLAYLYGQICLGLYRGEDDTVESLIDEADSWENWAPYQQAFVCLCSTGFEIILAAIEIRTKWFNAVPVLSSTAPVFLAFLLCCMLRRILQKGDVADSDSPYRDFVKDLFTFQHHR